MFTPLRTTTKMAWQAAVSIAIAELICLLFDIDKGYWIVLTAMTLTTQTWGDNIKRSLERVSMTVLGGLLGTLLYWIIPDNSYLILAILLFFVFFAVYLFQIYHLIGVFALTGFVVFLFAMIGEWDFLMLKDRILDTAIGASIALLVGYFFLPIKTDIMSLFVGYIEKIQASLHLAFQSSKSNELATSHRLCSDFHLLRKSALLIHYEVLFHKINRREFLLLMTESAFCTQYVTGLIETFYWLGPYLDEEDKYLILRGLATTQHNLECLRLRLQREDHPHLIQPANFIDILTKAINENPQRFTMLDNEVLSFFNVMYFFMRLNIRINTIYRLLGKMKTKPRRLKRV